MHKQVTTTSPVAIKLGQERLHVSAESYHPWHRQTDNVQCPDCETIFSVTVGFPREQFLETLKQHHQKREEHPDLIAFAPEWTDVSECDCGKWKR